MTAMVFTQNGCGYCEMAKELLKKHDIYYREVNINLIDGAKEELLTKCQRLGFTPKTVPQIWIDNEYIGGYTELKEKLES